MSKFVYVVAEVFEEHFYWEGPSYVIGADVAVVPNGIYMSRRNARRRASALSRYIPGVGHRMGHVTKVRSSGCLKQTAREAVDKIFEAIEKRRSW